MNQGQRAVLQAYGGAATPRTGVAKTIELYDHAIDQLLDARVKWKASVFDSAFDAMQRAAATVSLLSATLDETQRSRVSETLRRYYVGLSFQILSIPRQPDPIARIDSLFDQIRVVREAWAQVQAQESEERQEAKGSIRDTVNSDLV